MRYAVWLIMFVMSFVGSLPTDGHKGMATDHKWADRLEYVGIREG